MNIIVLLIICVSINLTASSCSQAQDIELEKIVVTPSRTEEGIIREDTNTQIVKESNLKEKNSSTLDESFKLINGLDIVGGGKFGTITQGINIRGAQTRHTVYMLEGIKIYDPSNTSGYYVPSDFLVSGLRRIEIVKMPLSSLYGSSCLGGAVNFFVKTPKTKPYIYFEEEGGSFSTVKEILELGGMLNNLSYLFNVARLDSEGFSKAKMKNNNPEDDAYQNTNFTLKLHYQMEDELETGFVTKVIHSRTENDDDDDYNGIPEDDLDNISWNNELFSTIYLKKKINPILSYKIQTGITSIFRKYSDDNDGHINSDNYVSAWYKGKTYQLLNHFEINPTDFYKALLGFDYTREIADSYRYDYSYAFGMGFASDFPKETTYSKGFFLEHIINPSEELRIDFSYRLEKNPIFKDHSVIKGNAGYRIPRIDTQISAAYSEGFKSPSLYQLFDPARGNKNLRPEESKTWEIGFIQPFSDDFSLSFCYFHSNFNNLIDFVYTNPTFWIGEYRNAAKASSRGIEIESRINLTKQLRFKTGYTYTTGKQDFVDDDLVTIFSNRLLRIPKHKAFLDISWEYQKLFASIDLLFVGGRTDRIWIGMSDEFAKMKPYLLGNISLNYSLQENKTLFFKINNIFNNSYERIKGFQEEPTAIYGGLKLRF